MHNLPTSSRIQELVAEFGLLFWLLTPEFCIVTREFFMTGKIMLIGGGEFQNGMEGADSEALNAAGGAIAPVVLLAVASSPRKTDDLLKDGLIWFDKLGAYNVKSLALNDHNAATKSENAAILESARLIYVIGGDPAYIPSVLAASACSEALRAAVNKRDAVVVGSGNGAMALAAQIYNQDTHELTAGLKLVPNTAVIPYHNSNGRKWSKKLNELLPDSYILGLDEKTAMLGFGNDWQVWGRSWVTVYHKGRPRKFVRGQPFKFN